MNETHDENSILTFDSGDENVSIQSIFVEIQWTLFSCSFSLMFRFVFQL